MSEPTRKELLAEIRRLNEVISYHRAHLIEITKLMDGTQRKRIVQAKKIALKSLEIT